MDKKLDLVIVEAIKSIIAGADCDVEYTIHKGSEETFLKKPKKEVVRVNIDLTKNIINE